MRMYKNNQFTRTELALGKEGLEKIKNSKIVLFGLGGVGSYIAEALARIGVQNLIIVDGDVVDITNINRQLIANMETIGRNKAELVKERINLINPLANVVAISRFVKSESDIDFVDGTVDYVIDAIDDFDAKIMIIKKSKELELNLISSMGTAKRLHGEMFKITDISKTSVCPLAKKIRKELNRLKISKVKVLYSDENPIETHEIDGYEGKSLGSVSFVPPVAGMLIAGEVVRDLLK
jgi:dinucleotide-utilizing enzyme